MNLITFVASTGPHNDAAIKEFSSLKLRGSDIAELSVAEWQEPEWSFLVYATKKCLIKFVDSLRNKKASYFNALNYCGCSEPNPYTSLTGECSCITATEKRQQGYQCNGIPFTGFSSLFWITQRWSSPGSSPNPAHSTQDFQV